MATKENNVVESNNLENKLNKKLKSKSAKYLLITILAVLIAVVYYTVKNNAAVSKTKINTPVIARTELSKKEDIDIKLFDDVEEDSAKSAMATELKDANSEENIKSLEDKVSAEKLTIKTQDQVIKHVTDLELAQLELANKVTALEENSNAVKLDAINAKLTKIESLNGNIGNLSKIFLGQQLVMLDNAFKVGGNQNLAIKNIYNFAKNVAKNDAVSARLQDLLTLTKEQAIITPAALNFYALELKNIKLTTLKPTKANLDDDATVLQKIKAFIKSFVVIKKQAELTEEQKLWNKNIAKMQDSIIFGNFVRVEDILENEELAKLGGEDFTNFKQLFATYLKQQQAMQAVLGAFIEGYSYDY